MAERNSDMLRNLKPCRRKLWREDKEGLSLVSEVSKTLKSTQIV